MRPARFVFSLATLIGSFILFLVQPMAAKMLLPSFGGSPAVWTAAMLFFQVLLLAGYVYAHAARKLKSTRTSALIHVGLLILASALFQFSPKALERNPESGIPPALQVFGLLAIFVGPAYLLISSGSPTLQRWFAHTTDPAAPRPYFLYSISNAGSLAGLLAYPFFVERRFTVSEQRGLFGYGLIALTLGAAACIPFIRSQPAFAGPESAGPESAGPESAGPESAGPECGGTDPQAETSQKPDTGSQSGALPSRTRLMRWIILAAVPSSLLLGATTFIGANIAPMPLIWVVPLSLYLLTFIVAFADRAPVTAAQIGRYLPIALVPLALMICLETTRPVGLMATVHLIAFTAGALMCHLRLAEDKPPAEHLTGFYLAISLGGAAGGLFNSLIAPTIFGTYAEYPIALVALAALRPETHAISARSKQIRLAAGIGAILLAIAIVKFGNLPPGGIRSGIGIGLPLVAAFAVADAIPIFAILLGITFFAVQKFDITAPGNIKAARRSFFGVHRVIEAGGFRTLVHGSTVHGRQWQTPSKRKVALTYYYPTGPIGSLMSSPRLTSRVKSIGLVGLGVGSLAAYGKPWQKMTYFEIDPEVLYLARDSGLFTFLKDSPAELRYVLGDARQTLEKEPDGSFDLLVLDAFSSDAIPTHLLTLEAIQMYERKLGPGGMIALHVSNHFLDLNQVVAETAARAKLFSFEYLDGATDDEMMDGKLQSRWMLLTRAESDKEILERHIDWTKNDILGEPRPWTDEYTNILDVYRPED